jgi:tetratricopeptide (TPR) repeat protein
MVPSVSRWRRVERACRGTGCGAVVLAATLGALLVTDGASQVIVPPGLGTPAGQAVPSPGFDLALAALSAGDYSAGLEIAGREHKSGIRFGAQRWIDSIASAAALGECHYELGNLREAVTAFDEALLLEAAHADWLLAVQFPARGPQPLGKPRTATWGRSQRPTAPGSLPEKMSIRLGGDPQQALQRGGVLAPPVDYPIRPQEIMRALTIALYRRGVILGRLAGEGPAIAAAAKALERRQAPPNHYSQSWIDVALGTALWAQGKSDLAQPLLTRGLVVANQFDHPLTPWALLVLGRIALEAEQFPAAARSFEEATYAAADFGDARALEEAFRLAAAAHLAAGGRGAPPALRGGADWARGGLPVLRGLLLALEAESLAVAGEPQAAAAALSGIDGRLLRGEPGRGIVGCQQAYAAALTAYCADDVVNGDRELDRALDLARRRSAAIFQTTRLVELVVGGAGGLSDRQADLLFAALLGDPSTREVAVDPLAALATTTTPRGEAFDAWIAAALRRGNDAALAASDAATRSRWLVGQPLGGRRGAVERLLEADPAGLSRTDAARRAALLARHPAAMPVLDGLIRGRPPLIAAVAAAVGQPPEEAAGKGGPPGDPAAWREQQRLVDRCRQIAARIAAGRDPLPIEMPPLVPPAELRRRLPPRHLILSFHWTSVGLLGALDSRDRVALWQVRQPAAVAKEIAALARGLCLFDPTAPVSTERLAAGEWQTPAERLERLLFENSKIDLSTGIDELVIVPDGMLWYLPFELLPVSSAREADAAARRLRDTCRIRYCPTRSLAVLGFEPSRGESLVGVHAGRLFRGDKPPVALGVAGRLAESLDRAVVLPPAVPAAPLPAALVDALVVLDEVSGDGPAAARPLLSSPTGRPAVSFGDWLGPPAKRPRCLVLPGFQSAVAGGLAKPPARPGNELFQATTDLIAAGGRTVVVSRWRMGGETCVDLVEEFLRDRVSPAADEPPPPAAESWQRAVELVMAEPPDLAREPRIKSSPQTVLTDSRHPFLWAGYMLVDCGSGRIEEPAPPAAGQAPAVAKPAVPLPAAPAPAPVPAPPAQQGPLNPALPRPPKGS